LDPFPRVTPVYNHSCLIGSSSFAHRIYRVNILVVPRALDLLILPLPVFAGRLLFPIESVLSFLPVDVLPLLLEEDDLPGLAFFLIVI